MSLILDALRKSERERLGRDPADRRPVGMDERDAGDDRPDTGRRWPIALGLVLALAILGGAAGYKLWPKPAPQAVAEATPASDPEDTAAITEIETPAPRPETESAVAAESAPATSASPAPSEKVVAMSAAAPVDDAPESQSESASSPVPVPEIVPEIVAETGSEAVPETGSEAVAEIESDIATNVSVDAVPETAAPGIADEAIAVATSEKSDPPDAVSPSSEPETEPVEVAATPPETPETNAASATAAIAEPVVAETALDEPETAEPPPVDVANAEPDRFPVPRAKPEPSDRPVPDRDGLQSLTAVEFYERAAAFEAEGLHERAIAAYTDAILQKPDFAEAYYGRAWAHIANGAYREAVDNFTRLLAIQPAMPEAYFGRGWAHERNNRSRQAILDYGEAIRIAPDRASLRFNRGILKLYEHDFVGAERDFMAIQDSGNAGERDLATLWTFVARAKAGTPLPDILPLLREAPAQSAWPGKIVEFYFGRAVAEDVIAMIATGDYREEAKRGCTAFYFLGQHALFSGNEADAANYFRRAVDTGATSLRQYWAALLELDRLGIAY